MTAKKTPKKAARTTARKSSAAKKVASPKKAAAKNADMSDIIAGPPAAFPPGFSNPATRALRNIGVTRLSELTAHRESDIAVLHGMGPKGVMALKAALTAQGKTFRA